MGTPTARSNKLTSEAATQQQTAFQKPSSLKPPPGQ